MNTLKKNQSIEEKTTATNHDPKSTPKMSLLKDGFSARTRTVNQ